MTFEPRAAVICLDLQRYRAPRAKATDTLEACRALLDGARRRRWPVLHVHAGGPAGDLRPLSGFEPRPNEPVFVRHGPSAFSNASFTRAACALGGPLALAGFSLQDTVLATAFAAADRRLPVEVVLDCVIADEVESLSALTALFRPLERLGPDIQATTLKDLLQPEAGRLAAANTP